MKKVCLALLTILTLGMLCSCGGYIKNYSATILITSCQGDEARMEIVAEARLANNRGGRRV